MCLFNSYHNGAGKSSSDALGIQPLSFYLQIMGVLDRDAVCWSVGGNKVPVGLNGWWSMSLSENGFDFMSGFWNSCLSLVAFCSWSQQRGRELIQKRQREVESEKWWALTSLCNLVPPLILVIRVKELAPQVLQPAEVDSALPFWLMYSGCFPE